jgi:hypothetical protein
MRHGLRVTARLVTSDGIVHQPVTFNQDLVLVCDLVSPDIQYTDLRRFSWLELTANRQTTCLGCLAEDESP